MDDCGGEEDGGDNDENCSESEGIVNCDVDRSRVGEGDCSRREDMVMFAYREVQTASEISSS